MPGVGRAPSDGSTLDYALSYASVGLRVLPIKPGTKRPPMQAWVEAATTDAAIITNWFTNMYADCGVGLAMGRQPDGRMIFALDVDEHDPAYSGSETLLTLEREHGGLPDTALSLTGANGVHLLFSAPEGVEVRNGVAGEGLDVRGEGGQIVVAPTIHPRTSTRYEWEVSYAPWERDIAEAPDWLISLVRSGEYKPPPPPPPSPPPAAPAGARFEDPDDGESPADWVRSNWEWPTLLAVAGWEEHHVDRRTGDTHWTRPGKNRREGSSAVLHQPDGPLVVFSTDASMGELRAAGKANTDGSVSLSLFEFFAAAQHNGDLSTAGRTIRKLMSVDTDSRLSALAPLSADDDDDDDLGFVDWDALLNGTDMEDAIVDGLVFPGRWTGFIAPPKAGKSTFALHLAHNLARGRHPFDGSKLDEPHKVLYIDTEMGQIDMRDRVRDLGLAATDVANITYTDSLRYKLDTKEGARWLRKAVAKVQPTIVVFDGLNGLVGGAEKDDTPWRLLFEWSIFPLKKEGIAIISADNMGKDETLGARGSSVKHDKADAIITVKATDLPGAMLRVKYRRTGSYLNQDAEYQIEGLDGSKPITYRPLGGTAVGWPGGSKLYPLVRLLDRLGVPAKASKIECGKAIRGAGEAISNDLLTKVVKWRKDGNTTPEPKPGDPDYDGSDEPPASPAEEADDEAEADEADEADEAEGEATLFDDAHDADNTNDDDDDPTMEDVL